jgi:uncharacterized protein (TIGR01244 family)
MEIRQITPDFAVGPQIEPADMAKLAAAGFVAVINNRPDAEVPPDLQSAAMQAAAEAAGLSYTANQVINGGLSMAMVQNQGAAVSQASGPVFAWCRSGTRSSMVWALAHAGKIPTDEIIAALDGAGYQIPGLDQQIEALADSSV